MSKNQIQHQSGYSLPDLFKQYGSEKQCVDALFSGNGQRALAVQNVHLKAIALLNQ